MTGQEPDAPACADDADAAFRTLSPESPIAAEVNRTFGPERHWLLIAFAMEHEPETSKIVSTLDPDEVVSALRDLVADLEGRLAAGRA